MKLILSCIFQMKQKMDKKRICATHLVEITCF